MLLPVFYDPTGRRKYYVGATCLVIILAAAFAAFFMHDAAVKPKWALTGEQGSSHPRSIIERADVKDVPLIGDTERGMLNRVVLTERNGNDIHLVDPYSGEVYRTATDDEKQIIGNSPYATESYGVPADRQLMLTFDDGPDAIYTPEILDLLSAESVPATFFVVGKAVAKNPDILQRIVREGHMVGNHTATHPDMNEQSDSRNRDEIVGTDRLIRQASNYSTRIFRIPEGDPDSNPLTLLQSQQLGYVHVNMDLDTRDWEYNLGESIAVPELDGKGHVVLLHDGGGDRSATITMLKTFISEAKSQGYTFTTVAPLLPEKFASTKNADSSFADAVTYYAAQSVWVVPARVLGWLFWFGVGSMTIMSVFYMLLALWGERRARRRIWPDIPDSQLPTVCVAVSAYNESSVITKTLDSLRLSNYPRSKLRVIAVDDGSHDTTLQVLRAYAAKWPALTVLSQYNQGKSVALNNAIKQSDDDVIVTIDADTLVRVNTIRSFARHFVRNRRIAAVAGHVKVGNRRNILTAWQSLEYISGICVTRMAESTINAISIVPGACAAWRRSVLQSVGGFSDTTMAEDADLALAIQRRGFKIIQENDAVADTEAPETISALAKQRLRWTFGSVQALYKHRSMLFRPRYGMLGMVTMPYALMSLIIPLLFMPATVVVAALSIAGGNWVSVVWFAAFVAGVHMIVSIIAIAIVREDPRHLLVVPIYRIIYEPLRAYLLYASLLRIIKGRIVAWDKLERSNTVTAFAQTVK